MIASVVCTTPSLLELPQYLLPQSCAGKDVGIRSLAVSLMDHTLLASPWPGDAGKISGSSVHQVLLSFG